MTEAQYLALCDKYFAGQCSARETQLIEQYQQQNGIANADWDTLTMGDQQRIKLLLQSKLEQSMHQRPTQVISISRWMYAAVASILLFVSIGVYFYKTSNEAEQDTLAQNIDTAQIKPGSSKAILTLANGKTIELDGAGNGVLESGESGAITKSGNGIVIDDNEHASASAIALNTITIPRGGKYDITLPDGTKVWLNSASSLTFPITFKGKERRVTLTGEAYFEVAKNKKMPFKINVNNKQEIEVLGTHFNVNAYADEPNITTTLLEGSVKVNYNKKSVLIKPGQMAVNDLKTDIKVQQADMEVVMAWKNDMFLFNDANIVSIMNAVSRWYDVDVAYKGDMRNINFTGNYSRTKGLNSLLKNIALMDKVKFKVEGRRVTVIDK